MKPNSISRWAMLLVLTLAFFTAAEAQKGLYVNNAFKLFGHKKGCTMVELKDIAIEGCRIDVFKSLTFKKYAAEIATEVGHDRKKAKRIREIVHDGKIQSGCYQMPVTPKGSNRFVVFSYTSSAEGALIYIEGKISIDDIMRICYRKESQE